MMARFILYVLIKNGFYEYKNTFKIYTIYSFLKMISVGFHKTVYLLNPEIHLWEFLRW